MHLDWDITWLVMRCVTVQPPFFLFLSCDFPFGGEWQTMQCNPQCVWWGWHGPQAWVIIRKHNNILIMCHKENQIEARECHFHDDVSTFIWTLTIASLFDIHFQILFAMFCYPTMRSRNKTNTGCVLKLFYTTNNLYLTYASSL